MSSQIIERGSQSKAEFSNPVVRWIDYRLPVFTFLDHELNSYPTPRNLNRSVEHIMRDVNYGWLIRYVHTTGASIFFAVVYIHIFRGLYY